MRLYAVALAALLTGGAGPAWARDLCAERPGLGTPACTVEPGRLQVETELVDWSRDRRGRDDTLTIGMTEFRLGTGASSEMQLWWTPWARERVREADGHVDRTAGPGDVRLGFKRNIRNPDGHGVSMAVLPYVTLPVGRGPAGEGDWGAGLVVPLTWDVADAVQLEWTTEIDAAVNEDGQGRHLAYGGVGGVEFDLAPGLELTAEVQATRDRDPAGHATQWLGGLGMAWQPMPVMQLDIGGAAGLNRDAPGLRLYGGVTRRF